MIRRIRMLRPLLVIAAAVAAFGLTALPASAAGSGQPRVTTHAIKTHAIKLTPQQVQALRRAHAANPHLSVAQARMAINSVRGVSLNSSGYDESVGDCSFISLWGDSDGNYAFNQTVYPQSGQAVDGLVSISTDGAFASEDDWDPVIGRYQSYGGTLAWTGVWPSGTTMSGWMVTDTDLYCFGSLFAIWV